MIEKIEWYREVLELEPNSKVFFPLARLLVESGESDEAIKVLETGLERHPDFMEARLFLIELMHKAGMDEACSAQISKLSKMFARYAGFWQAWAACLSSEPGEEDTASIIRFLAAHFLVGPLKISEALNLGLAEIIKKHQSRPDAATAESGASIAAEEAGAESPSLTGSAVDLGVLAAPEASEKTAQASAAGAFSEDMEISAEIRSEAPPVEPFGAIEPEEAAESLSAMPQAAREEAPEETAQQPEPMETAALEDAPVQIDPLETGLAETEMIETGQAGAAAEEPEAQASESLAEESRAGGPGGESFSLRTRSMAEVLADQGDFQGALDIYKELAAAEKNSKELKNLKKRISELKKLKAARPARETDPEEIPMESAEEPGEEAGGEIPSRKKERLLGILQALAKRVEARINS